MPPRDTTPEALAVQRESLRALGGARRVELAIEMSEQAREIAIAGMLARDPGLTREAARARLLRRILGDELYEAAYGSAEGR